MTLFLRSDLKGIWSKQQAFYLAQEQQGDVYREKEGRRTLCFQAAGKSYFLKYHSGIGWNEIFKNLTQAKLPIISAMNEVYAIKAVAKAGINTMTIAGYGERGWNWAKRESFIVTDDLSETISLEELAIHWHSFPPTTAYRRKLIRQVASIARRMHEAGVNHRDFYLCHFLVNRSDALSEVISPLYVIDLHRAQIRKTVPTRWLIKDLGGLYFSAAPANLSRKEVKLFIYTYCHDNSRHLPAIFWRRVEQTGIQHFEKFYREPAFYPLSTYKTKSSSS